MKKIFKYGLMFVFIALAACRASADLQLSISADYPVKLDLKVPVQENSDFKIYTTFGDGQFFNATGHVGQLTGTNELYTMTCWYEYNVSNSDGRAASGSSTVTSSGSIHSEYRQRIATGGFDPGFDLEEVPPPASPWSTWTNTVPVPAAP